MTNPNIMTLLSLSVILEYTHLPLRQKQNYWHGLQAPTESRLSSHTNLHSVLRTYFVHSYYRLLYFLPLKCSLFFPTCHPKAFTYQVYPSNILSHNTKPELEFLVTHDHRSVFLYFRASVYNYAILIWLLEYWPSWLDYTYIHLLVQPSWMQEYGVIFSFNLISCGSSKSPGTY